MPHLSSYLVYSLRTGSHCLFLGRLNIAYLNFLNKKHEQRRVSMGKSAKIIDHSMAAVGAISKEDEMEDEGTRGADDNAFKDMADIENEDFVYVF